jgi:malic enzyme
VGMDFMKARVTEITNPKNITGTLSDALAGADVFIGLSTPGVLAVRAVKRMARDRIVFAMANPCPRSGRNRPSATPASSPPPVRLCEPD